MRWFGGVLSIEVISGHRECGAILSDQLAYITSWCREGIVVVGRTSPIYNTCS
jgi:hypothetical protein